MKVNNNGADVCRNAQTAVDQKHKLVVDTEVINNAADQGQLYNIANQAKETLEVDELKALGNANLKINAQNRQKGGLFIAT